jgi:hypothetical protein
VCSSAQSAQFEHAATKAACTLLFSPAGCASDSDSRRSVSASSTLTPITKLSYRYAPDYSLLPVKSYYVKDSWKSIIRQSKASLWLIVINLRPIRKSKAFFCHSSGTRTSLTQWYQCLPPQTTPLFLCCIYTAWHCHVEHVRWS